MKVGDVGIIVYNGGRARTVEAKVAKVGRKWASLDVGSTWDHPRCDLATGVLDGGNYMSPGTFYTTEAFAHRERMHEANEIITELGLSFRLGARWKDEDALALAEWLRAHFADSFFSPKGNQ